MSLVRSFVECNVLYNVVCSNGVSNLWLKFTKPFVLLKEEASMFISNHYLSIVDRVLLSSGTSLYSPHCCVLHFRIYLNYSVLKE